MPWLTLNRVFIASTWRSGLAEDSKTCLGFGKFRLPGGRVVCVNMTSDLFLLGLRGSVENLT